MGTIDGLPGAAHNLAFIHRHARLFGVPPSPIQTALENLVVAEKQCEVEVSCKLDPGTAFSGRFNVMLRSGPGDTERAFVRAMSFIGTIAALPGCTVDTARIDHELGNADRTAIDFAPVGVDIRPQLSDSRVKLWFVHESKEAIEALCAREGDSIRPFFIGPRHVLVGVQMSLDGRSRARYYYRYDRSILEHAEQARAFENLFSANAVELLKGAHHAYATLPARRWGLEELAIDFFLLREPMDHVVEQLAHAPLTAIHRCYRRASLGYRVLSLDVPELREGTFSRIKVYYGVPLEDPTLWGLDAP